MAEQRKKMNVVAMKIGIRIANDHKVYPRKDGVRMRCWSAIAFTMKLGPLPM